MTNQFTIATSTKAIRRWGPPAMVLLGTAALTALIAAPPAEAASRQAHPERVTEATAPRDAGEPIMAIVSIKSQKVTIYDSDGWVLRAPVSSGQKGRETPAGVFSVIQKDADHHSNLYDDAFMPHMQRITWSGIALHGGPLPGYPASHGCIRMPYDFAERLFGETRLGMRVIIAPDDAVPIEIVHPALFSPKPDAGAHAAALAADEVEATRKADEARIASATAAREAARAALQARKLENLKARAEALFAAKEAALGAAHSDKAKARAEDAKQKAAARIADLQAQWDAAKVELQAKLDAVAPAREAAVTAETARAATAKAAHEAARELDPVSIFISRKTQRLYVRRGFEPILESPVTILHADSPIGTYVFTAVARTDSGLRWTVVTLDDGHPRAVVEVQARPHADGGRDLEPVPAYASAAKSALDRIVIPQEVLDRIASTALPRSSLIISDEALSPETGKDTEFVAVLSNEPQGGLAMRRHGPATEFRYTRQRERQFYWRPPFGAPFSTW
jgi:lipoprotein-anchoring transpeptidase ErfK/SrfK